MPELPEVEVIRRFLKDTIVGATITDVKILEAKSFSGDKDQIIGKKIIKLSRIGKQLSIHLSNNLLLLIHLKMTGQFIYVGARRDAPKTTILGHPTPKLNNSKLPNRSTRIIFKLSVGAKRDSPQKEGVFSSPHQIRSPRPRQVCRHRQHLRQ